MIRYSYEQDQKEFFDYKLGRLPSKWRLNVRDEWGRIQKKEGIRAANLWLTALVEPLENLLNIAHDDDDLQKLAKENSRHCEKLGGSLSGFINATGLLDQFVFYCKSWGVRYPEEHDRDGAFKRLTCSVWWLRNLRQAHARAREVAAINAGLVHRKGNLYVSDDTLDRRAQQNRRNRLTLEGVKLKSESGQIMALSDIAGAGVSNPDNRRAELMTRIAGFEALATDKKYKYFHMAEFITVTCPSRMHAVLRDGKPNQKYDGTKPDEAQRYLVEVWARVRAKFHRDGFKCYGLRVAEPHHDGTPHWHLILFYKPEKMDLSSGGSIQAKHYMRGVIRNHFMLDSMSEAGADKNRVKFVSIDPAKGTASGYIMKYVAKNIGGIEDDKHTGLPTVSDEGVLESKTAAARVEAWASTWRIRQFQQIGGHSVTVWRELRRVDEGAINKDFRELMRAWRACQKRSDKEKADFAEFIEAMGGLRTAARESVVCLDDDFVMRLGRYGEAATHVVNGVRMRFKFDSAANNRESWVRV